MYIKIVFEQRVFDLLNFVDSRMINYIKYHYIGRLLSDCEYLCKFVFL